ncbi:MAG: mobile mystery protein B [Candidatus Krumholzibacteria bacterium]|nr:mobile mystery protein B [Candidatus Krumholzibacteria bacterium]
MEFKFPEGGTPLDPDEIEGLLIPTISTRYELDTFEFENNRRASEWVDTIRTSDILVEPFIRKLHKKMFGDVWRWAGKYRTSNKSIGVFWEMIPEEIGVLLGNVHFWVKERSIPDDEIGARFHHRLVSIHPFSNGNGRHGRLMTDLLMEKILKTDKFSWGDANLSQEGDMRARYIEALIEADNLNFVPLIEFVRK